MKVGEFLSLPLPPWDWQEQDCCRWVDRWVQIRGYGSAISALGLRYSTEVGALRVIKRGGGLTSLWARGMEAIGVPAVSTFQAGDVAVIERATLTGPDEAMAIYTGTRWASLALRGIEYGPATPERAWRL